MHEDRIEIGTDDREREIEEKGRLGMKVVGMMDGTVIELCAALPIMTSHISSDAFVGTAIHVALNVPNKVGKRNCKGLLEGYLFAGVHSFRRSSPHCFVSMQVAFQGFLLLVRWRPCPETLFMCGPTLGQR